MKNIYYCFPGGKYKVATFSYDDGREEDRRLVELFNKYKLKGTFHLNAGLNDRKDRIPLEEIAKVYKGHEVAAHTLTHPTIERCPKEMLVHQVMEDRRILESFLDYPVRGLSYPNGSYTPEIMDLLPHLGIEYARTVGGHHTFQMPRNFLEWQATCHHNKSGLEDAKAFRQLFKSQYMYMLYIWGHSYEFTNDNNWEYMEEICKTVADDPDTWYASNIEIVDYMNALKGLRFNVECSKVWNPSAQTLYLKVSDTVVEVPGGGKISL